MTVFKRDYKITTIQQPHPDHSFYYSQDASQMELVPHDFVPSPTKIDSTRLRKPIIKKRTLGTDVKRSQLEIEKHRRSTAQPTNLTSQITHLRRAGDLPSVPIQSLPVQSMPKTVKTSSFGMDSKFKDTNHLNTLPQQKRSGPNSPIQRNPATSLLQRRKSRTLREEDVQKLVALQQSREAGSFSVVQKKLLDTEQKISSNVIEAQSKSASETSFFGFIPMNKKIWSRDRDKLAKSLDAVHAHSTQSSPFTRLNGHLSNCLNLTVFVYSMFGCIKLAYLVVKMQLMPEALAFSLTQEITGLTFETIKLRASICASITFVLVIILGLLLRGEAKVMPDACKRKVKPRARKAIVRLLRIIIFLAASFFVHQCLPLQLELTWFRNDTLSQLSASCNASIWASLLIFGSTTMPEFIWLVIILMTYITLKAVFCDIDLGDSSISAESKELLQADLSGSILRISMLVFELLLQAMLITSLFSLRLLRLFKYSKLVADLVADRSEKAKQMDVMMNKMSKNTLICKIDKIQKSIVPAELQALSEAEAKPVPVFHIQVERISQDFGMNLPRKKKPAQRKKSSKVNGRALAVEQEEQCIEIKFQQELKLNFDKAFLEEKIFIPYCISNNTILSYEKQEEQQFSVAQILADQFTLMDKRRGKGVVLYFRVPKSVRDKENLAGNSVRKRRERRINSDQSEASHPYKQSESFHDFESSSNFNSQKSMKDDSSDSDQLMTKLERLEQQKQDLHMDEDSQYFEFEIQVMKEGGDRKVMLIIREVTSIVRYQQKASDMIYQEAIEANYSHEQMTPLNNIMSNSRLIKDELQLMLSGVDKSSLDMSRLDIINMMLWQILNSGKVVYLYNKNQIDRMKIKKGQFKENSLPISHPDKAITKVIEPFSTKILGKKIGVQIIQKHAFPPGELEADWERLSLALFNLVQNAIKYTSFNGDIVFLISLPKKEDIELSKQRSKTFKYNQSIGNEEKAPDDYVLDIEIIDTGSGIEEDRQQYLFTPFLELKVKQSLNQVKDNNIGMGLSCSKMILEKLGGSVKLKSSKKGLTVFHVQIPIRKYHPPAITRSNKGNTGPGKHTILFSFSRKINCAVLDLLRKQHVDERMLNLQTVATETIQYIKVQDVPHTFTSHTTDGKYPKDLPLFRRMSVPSAVVAEQALVNKSQLKQGKSFKQRRSIRLEQKESSDEYGFDTTPDGKRKPEKKISVNTNDVLSLNFSRTLKKGKRKKPKTPGWMANFGNNSASLSHAASPDMLSIRKSQLHPSPGIPVKKPKEPISPLRSQGYRTRFSNIHLLPDCDSFTSQQLAVQEAAKNKTPQYRKSSRKLSPQFKFSGASILSGGGGRCPQSPHNLVLMKCKSGNSPFPDHKILMHNLLLKQAHFDRSEGQQNQALHEHQPSQLLFNNSIRERKSRSTSNRNKLVRLYLNERRSSISYTNSSHSNSPLPRGLAQPLHEQHLHEQALDLPLGDSSSFSREMDASGEPVKETIFDINSDFGSNSSQFSRNIDKLIEERERKKAEQEQEEIKMVDIEEGSSPLSPDDHFPIVKESSPEHEDESCLLFELEDYFPVPQQQENESIIKMPVKRTSQGYLARLDRSPPILTVQTNKRRSIHEVRVTERKSSSNLMIESLSDYNPFVIESGYNDRKLNSGMVSQNNSVILSKSCRDFTEILMNAENLRMGNGLNQEFLVDDEEFEIEDNGEPMEDEESEEGEMEQSMDKFYDVEAILEVDKDEEQSVCLSLAKKSRNHLNYKGLSSNKIHLKGQGQVRTSSLQSLRSSSSSSQTPNVMFQPNLRHAHQTSKSSKSETDRHLRIKNSKKGPGKKKQWTKNDPEEEKRKPFFGLKEPSESQSLSSSSSLSSPSYYPEEKRMPHIQIRAPSSKKLSKIRQSYSIESGGSMPQDRIGQGSVKQLQVSSANRKFSEYGSSYFKNLAQGGPRSMSFSAAVRPNLSSEVHNQISFAQNGNTTFQGGTGGGTIGYGTGGGTIGGTIAGTGTQPGGTRKLSTHSQRLADKGQLSELCSDNKSGRLPSMSTSLKPEGLKAAPKKTRKKRPSVILPQQNSKTNKQVSLREVRDDGCDCQPKIMLVDDNDFNLMPLSMLVASLFQVKTVEAFDGLQAVELFREHYQKPCKCENRAFKFIFMDIQMPEMDGWEATRQILEMTRASGEPNFCHIVALTSFTSEGVRQKAMRIGMKDLINKPLRNKELQLMVYRHYFRLSDDEIKKRFPKVLAKE